jgi:hypothetical protein
MIAYVCCCISCGKAVLIRFYYNAKARALARRGSED